MLNIIHNEPMRFFFLILWKPSKGVGSLFSKAKSTKGGTTAQCEASLEILGQNRKRYHEEVTLRANADDKAVLPRLQLLSLKGTDLKDGP